VLLRGAIQLSVCSEHELRCRRVSSPPLQHTIHSKHGCVTTNLPSITHVKILIVDDQVEARNSLIRLCERSDNVEVVGEAACGAAAIEAVAKVNPDIMILDVRLPDMSGFELLRAVGSDTHPLGIMVSTDADQAIRAFAEGAIDYLVTPVSAERFDRAMIRARHRINSALPADGPFSWQSSDLGSTTPGSPRFLVGERQRRLYPLDPKTIDYIEAHGNYVTLRAGKSEYLSRDSIKRLATQLAELGFIRIERSLLVNAAAVSYAEVAGHGTFALTLCSGVCLHSSATYRDSILRIIPLPALSKRYRGATS
jgi:two-component system, LytTR family, response regulator